MKVDELQRKIQHYEEVFSRLCISKLNEVAFAHFKQEFGNIGVELGILGRYTRLNFTGIVKILKKHDRHTPYTLKSMFLLHFRNNPLYVNNMDILLLRLSNLYNRLSIQSEHNVQYPTPTSDQQANSETFVRKTTKFWVHPDNVTDVKLAILKHIPVIVYNSPNKLPPSSEPYSQKLDFAISSVYLDNSSLELYLGRLEKTEGAEAIRIRWYGKSHDPEYVFIERKVHREDWTGEISVKSRFQIKEKHVANFLTGNYTLEKTLMKKRLLKLQESSSIDLLAKLSSEVQDTILKKELHPYLRTKYNRMAFQYPGDESVRISLDTELMMIKEDPEMSSGYWKRDDLSSEEYRYPELLDNEIVRFPYAILEVKLQTESGTNPPKWITDLISSQLVEEVPKFSKFVHGIAVLYEKKVQLFPFWISQMNIDIRQKASFSSPLRSADSVPDFNSGSITPLLVASSVPSATGTPIRSFNESVPEDNEHHVIIDIASKEKSPLLLKQTPKLMSSSSDRNRKSSSKDSLLSRFLKPKQTSSLISPRLSSSTQLSTNRIVGGSRIQTTSGGITAPSKKIAIPVRVEPKVFFANERTFLSWLHFSIFLGGISTALVGLGHKTARFSGYLFTFVSVIFSFYALYTYLWRAKKIRRRDPGPYDDLMGPSVLVVVFLMAMLVNFIFTIYKEDKEIFSMFCSVDQPDYSTFF